MCLFIPQLHLKLSSSEAGRLQAPPVRQRCLWLGQDRKLLLCYRWQRSPASNGRPTASGAVISLPPPRQVHRAKVVAHNVSLCRPLLVTQNIVQDSLFTHIQKMHFLTYPIVCVWSHRYYWFYVPRFVLWHLCHNTMEKNGIYCVPFKVNQRKQKPHPVGFEDLSFHIATLVESHNNVYTVAPVSFCVTALTCRDQFITLTAKERLAPSSELKWKEVCI